MQKQIVVDGLLWNYNIHENGSDKPRLVMLHGRGQSRRSFELITKYIPTHNIIIPDFPGFGGSHIPNSARGIPEYAKALASFLTKTNIKTCDVLCHSFGGRVAIDLYLTENIKINRLILIASGGYRPPITLKGKIFLAIKNITDKIGLTKLMYNTAIEKYVQLVFASRDYAHAQGMMKQIVKLAVNYDQSQVLHKINIPTLLIWGTKDDETPVTDAYYFHQEIKNSILQIKEGATHFVFQEYPERTSSLVTTFLNDTTK